MSTDGKVSRRRCHPSQRHEEGLPYECRGEGLLPRPCFIHIYPMLPLLPPSVGESGHALTETMDLGAMTLLGLIGTNHAETPPVQIGKAQSPYGGCAALHNIPCGMRSVKSMRSIAHTKLYPNLPLLSRKIPMFFRKNWVTQDVVVVFFPFNNTIRFSSICGESVEIFLLQYKYRIALWRFF